MKSGGDYARQLRQLSNLIKKTFKGFNSDLIEGLAQHCEVLKYAKSAEWSYFLEELVFPRNTLKVGKLDRTRPSRIKSYTVVLSVKATGSYYDSSSDKDLVKHLVVDIVGQGFEEIINNQRLVNLLESHPEAICAWHLDSHPPQATIGEYDSPFAHPRYHWQYGGEKVWHFDEGWFGTHLLLVSPRILHPPLDVILAIDFVLANFYAPIWKELRNESGYQRIIAAAQHYYWKPYFQQIAAIDWSKPPTDQTDYLYWPR